MKQVVVIFGGLSVLLLALLAHYSVGAQAGGSLSEGHIEKIGQNCTRAQASLERLLHRDALLRSDRGALYDSISSRLMMPLNRRIALNELGGASLVATTTQYNNQFDRFRAHYIQYEESMKSAIAIDCARSPGEFYKIVASTREKRQQVHADTVALVALLKSYRSDFEEFASNVLGDSQ